MLVLVIVWMTLMHSHHAIKSRTRDCYCLVGNDKCNLVIGLKKNLNDEKGFMFRF
jgi:hypothetical protein